MFRKMRRFKQEISREECIEVLKTIPRGVLSLIGDDGYPYGIPMDFWYNEKEGTVCFHGAKEGHKIDAIRSCDKACFTVIDNGYREEGKWALNIKSVIIFGRIKFTENEEKRVEIGTALCRRFSDDNEYLEHEIKNALPRALCFELIPEHMTGKLVNES